MKSGSTSLAQQFGFKQDLSRYCMSSTSAFFKNKQTIELE